MRLTPWQAEYLLKMSFDREPPRLGRVPGFAPVVCVTELAAHWTHGWSWSRRVARKNSSRAGRLLAYAAASGTVADMLPESSRDADISYPV